VLLASLHRLSGKLIHRTRCTHLRLIGNHVTQTLVIHHLRKTIPLNNSFETLITANKCIKRIQDATHTPM
jgi:hypothetical protein